MENKFYTDDFEQLLKEHADKFRMYPSKRVWRSIYNDLHPGRRWPSLAILLLLISSVAYVGLTNNNYINPKTAAGSDISSAVKENNTSVAAQTVPFITSEENLVNSYDKPSTVTANNIVNKKDELSTPVSQKGNQQFLAVNTNNRKSADTHRKNNALKHVAVNNNNTATSEIINNDMVSSIHSDGVSESQKLITTALGNADIDNTEDANSTITATFTDPSTKNKVSEAEPKLVAVANNTRDKAWIEDYAFHNKPSLSKWKTRSAYEVYFTPSVGYRRLSKNTNFNPSTALVATTDPVPDFEKSLNQAAAINIELGGNFLYAVSKNWNLKAGIQFNYTNYRVDAYELRHPTMTNLAINDVNSGFTMLSARSTTLANTSGLSSKKLNNNTYQLSIPMGADIKIAGKNNLKWYAGATIQPTVILGGNAYFISSDLKNYVTDKSLMRRMNLNAGVESFISYKTKSGLTINAGPQLRYQFFSTYTKKYTYDEKLYNLGMKIGIVTKF